MYIEKYNLTDRVAVVTGGGRNIGLACAHALIEAGAKVVVAEIDSGVAESGMKELARLGHTADFIAMDVTSVNDVGATANALTKKHGGVDILICNAGIGRSGVPAEKVEDERWLNVLDVNLNGVFWCCRAFGKHMLARGSGAIVNIGSMSGSIVNKPQPQSYYNTAKAGVHHLSRSLAAEWADRGVRVNCVAPTYVDNGPDRYGKNDETLFPVWMEMTPMHRQARQDEIASVVLFLASDASSMITGQVIHVDGGYTLW